MSRIKYNKTEGEISKLSYSPYRKMLLWIGIPCMIVIAISFVVGIILFANSGSLTGMYISEVICVIAVIFCGIGAVIAINREPKMEKERYAYLFNPVTEPFIGEFWEVKDGEFQNGGIVDGNNNFYQEVYTVLMKEGISICAKEKKEVVFNDVETVKKMELSFSPYENCSFKLGYALRKMRWCLFLYWQEKKENRIVAMGALILSKELFAVIKSFGLDKRINDPNWAYLLDKPEAFFKELYMYGRIRGY